MNEEIKINVVGMTDEKWRYESARRVYGTDGIAPACNTCGGGGRETKIVLGWSRDNKGNVVNRHPVDVANAVTIAKRDNTQNFVVENPKILTRPHGYYKGEVKEDVSPTVKTSALAENNYYLRIRKLTPRECFRLMDVSDEDIDKMQDAGISNSQQYKLAGNSIVVAVLEGIFEKLFIDTDISEPTLF